MSLSLTSIGYIGHLCLLKYVMHISNIIENIHSKSNGKGLLPTQHLFSDFYLIFASSKIFFNIHNILAAY